MASATVLQGLLQSLPDTIDCVKSRDTGYLQNHEPPSSALTEVELRKSL